MGAHVCFSISAQIWFGSMQALCTRPPLAENILHSKSNNLPILNRAKKLMVLTVCNASSIRNKPNFSFPCLPLFFLLVCGRFSWTLGKPQTCYLWQDNLILWSSCLSLSRVGIRTSASSMNIYTGSGDKFQVSVFAKQALHRQSHPARLFS